MKKITLLILNFVITISLYGQKFAVHFIDKNNSPYSIEEPLEFLSQKAMDRRIKFGIPITEADFPVNPTYVSELVEIGAAPTVSSRWLNCAIVAMDSSLVETVNELPFVSKVVYVYPENPSPSKSKKQIDLQLNANSLTSPINNAKDEGLDYGHGTQQIEQLNGIALHEQGYTGEGVLIAILDGGFNSVNQIEGFSHLFENDRVVLEKNIVNPSENIYHPAINTHGTSVLSCMAANLPGYFIGTAPDASYCFIRTEDADSEYLAESYYWAIGAELADSVGADIINSSLGYYEFDDPSMLISYEMLDGNTFPSSIAANAAIERGIHVIVAAGNSNGSYFPWVGTPANAPSVTTVGAVDEQGEYGSFSSIGPTSTGTLKPELAARGVAAVVFMHDGNAYYMNGTSFSSPILCGLTACLVQAHPELTPEHIKQRLIESASQYDNPDYYIGYGIPDFMTALESNVAVKDYQMDNIVKIYPNPAQNEIVIASEKLLVKGAVFDVFGRKQCSFIINNFSQTIDISFLIAGNYIMQFTDANGRLYYKKIVKM